MSLGPEAAQRVLRIKRFLDGEWQTEIVRDAAVINAYVRRRQTIEDEGTQADSLAPTGDVDKDKRAKKRLADEIARMKKNQERRLHRKNAKLAKEGGTPLALKRTKPDTTRRCGHCGQMGHMKTNRKCPRWAEFNTPMPPSLSAPTPAGLGGPAMPSPAAGASKTTAGFRHPGGALAYQAAVPSPLATSPPMSAPDPPSDGPGEGSSSGPKIKLTLKRG